MNGGLEPSRRDGAGSELLEWLVATAILTVAIYAILQAFGGTIESILGQLLEMLRRILQAVRG